MAQTDYKTSTKYKDGYTSVYISVQAKGNNYYNTTTESRFGLLNDNTGKIVLPIIYKSLFSSNEPDIYIIKDTLDNMGMINVKTGQYILKMEYYRIDPFSDGLAVVQKQDQKTKNFFFGAADKTGKIVVPMVYDYLGAYTEGLLNFKRDNKYGFIDKDEKLIIPNVYTNPATFGNGLAPARLPDTSNFGYINKQNKMVIPAIYVDAGNFTDGFARVYKTKGVKSTKNTYSDDEIGIIDVTGKTIIEPKYAYISSKLEGGTFQVQYRSRYGLIDSTGKLLQPTKYNDMKFFSGGYAVVKDTLGKFGLINTKGQEVIPTVNTEVDNKNGMITVKKDKTYSVLDKNLKTIIPPDTAIKVSMSKDRILMVFDNAVKLFDYSGKLIKTIKQDNVESYQTYFTNNDDSVQIRYRKSIMIYNILAKNFKFTYLDEVSDFNDEGIFLGKKSYNYDYYDYTFKKLNTKSYYAAHNFFEDIAAVQESSYSSPYLIGKDFKSISTLSYVFHGPYSEGLAKTKSQYGNTWYYLNKKGGTAFSVYAIEAGDCINGRIKIREGENSYFLLDKSGKKINTTSYQGLADISEGLARFKKNDKIGFIDTSGKVIIAEQFSEASDFTGGSAIAKTGTDFYLIDKTGKAINNDKYSAAKSPANGTFPVQKGLGFGLIDAKGKVLIDFKYQEVLPMYEDVAWGKKDGKWGLINSKGKEISSFDYEAANNFLNGYAAVQKGGKFGLMDKTGKLVLPAEYNSIGKAYKDAVLLVKDAYTIKVAAK